MATNTWLDEKEYPFTSYYFRVEGAQMHYIDVGVGETILFVHGTPSWSFEYRKIIKDLSKRYRCIAPDLIGFGLSDKPKCFDYSLESQATKLEAFIRFLRLQNITLVLHDFGGPISLRVATKHPDWIKKIVLLNTWAWNIKADVNLSLINSPILRLAYKWFNFSPRVLIPSSFGDKKITRDILKHYCKPFSKPSERIAPIVFARSFITEENWFDKLWGNLIVLCPVQVLLIWGMKDRFVKLEYIDKFKKVFSSASIHLLPGTGHFPQEEEPDKVSQLILDFINRESLPNDSNIH